MNQNLTFTTLSGNYALPTISVIQLMKTNQLLKSHQLLKIHLHKDLAEKIINVKRALNNIYNLRDEFHSLMTKIKLNEVLIRPTDEGSIVVVMKPEYIEQRANHV